MSLLPAVCTGNVMTYGWVDVPDVPTGETSTPHVELTQKLNWASAQLPLAARPSWSHWDVLFRFILASYEDWYMPTFPESFKELFKAKLERKRTGNKGGDGDGDGGEFPTTQSNKPRSSAMGPGSSSSPAASAAPAPTSSSSSGTTHDTKNDDDDGVPVDDVAVPFNQAVVLGGLVGPAALRRARDAPCGD